jgi:NCAIR mutase (PurE)-related protein
MQASVPADLLFDADRLARIGIAEAILCASKSPAQLDAIVAALAGRETSLLLTRLDEARHERLRSATRALLDYDPASRTAFVGRVPEPRRPARVAIVTGGTGDLAVALEAARTLAFHGEASERHIDIGAAGLWRLRVRRELRAGFPVVIAAAGMEGALFSVLAGLVGSAVIAVPTSIGYGVTEGGRAALHAALGSCAPGIMVGNIDNGFGAACAALRILRARDRG